MRTGQSPVVVCITGPPGAGKSSIGRALAIRLGWCLIDQDTATNPLLAQFAKTLGLPFDLNHQVFTGEIRTARYACLIDLAKENATLGVSTILVAPFTAESGDLLAHQKLAQYLIPGRLHLVHVETPPGERVARIKRRGAHRDLTQPIPQRSQPRVLIPEARVVDGTQRIEHIIEQIIADLPLWSRRQKMTGQPNHETRWIDSQTHRAWLDEQFRFIIRLARTTVNPSGGFHYPGVDTRPQPGRGIELFLNSRMAHACAIAQLKGIPGAGSLLDHAVWSVREVFCDPVHGGWVSTLDNPGGRKSTYDQVHVGLAAASGYAAGHPEASALLDQAIEVIETHLLDPDTGMLLETFAPDWSDSEPYRGANVNMHGVEAFLAMGDVTGDPVWHHRALHIAERIINRGARELNWYVPEHFDTNWQVLLKYNSDQVDHPFRPYGATLGHSFEWARFLIGLHSSPAIPNTPWLVEAAHNLMVAAFAGWAADGRPGLPYTVDWSGGVVSGLRMHWPLCEAIQACAAYDTATAGTEFERWYRRCWDQATAFICPDGGWLNELDADLRPSTRVWPGRPDIYHIAGALNVPTLPPTPFLTLAVAGRPSELG